MVQAARSGLKTLDIQHSGVYNLDMKITVNGITKEIKDGATVLVVLEELSLSKGRVAVELNRAIITRDSYPDTPLKDGDVLEILSFVGGG